MAGGKQLHYGVHEEGRWEAWINGNVRAVVIRLGPKLLPINVLPVSRSVPSAMWPATSPIAENREISTRDSPQVRPIASRRRNNSTQLPDAVRAVNRFHPSLHQGIQNSELWRHLLIFETPSVVRSRLSARTSSGTISGIWDPILKRYVQVSYSRSTPIYQDRSFLLPSCTRYCRHLCYYAIFQNVILKNPLTTIKNINRILQNTAVV